MASERPSWWIPIVVAAVLGFGLSAVKDCGHKDIASAERLTKVEADMSAVKTAHENELTATDKRMDRLEDKLDRIILMVLGEKPAARK